MRLIPGTRCRRPRRGGCVRGPTGSQRPGPRCARPAPPAPPPREGGGPGRDAPTCWLAQVRRGRHARACPALRSCASARPDGAPAAGAAQARGRDCPAGPRCLPTERRPAVGLVGPSRRPEPGGSASQLPPALVSVGRAPRDCEDTGKQNKTPQPLNYGKCQTCRKEVNRVSQRFSHSSVLRNPLGILFD